MNYVDQVRGTAASLTDSELLRDISLFEHRLDSLPKAPLSIGDGLKIDAIRRLHIEEARSRGIWRADGPEGK